MTDATSRALQTVAACGDAAKLERMVLNARRLGDGTVERAASLKLYEVLPSAEPGTLEHDVWRSVHALEHALTTERGKTTRLGRTRQKIARDGEQRTVADLVTGAASDGFAMLTARDMTDHTFEAVALRHPARFDGPVLAAAAGRLDASPFGPTPTGHVAGSAASPDGAEPASQPTPSSGPKDANLA